MISILPDLDKLNEVAQELRESASSNVSFENNRHFHDEYDEKHKDLKFQKENAELDILHFILKTSRDTSDIIAREEERKTNARRRFIIGLSITLGFCLLSSFILIVLDAVIASVNVSNALFIAFLSVVIAQIISLIVLFIKFINDVKSLDMHETVTKGLLEYLSKKS